MSAATERDLGKIETQITIARNLLMEAGMDLKRIGHDDSASEIDAIIKQMRQLRATTRERIGPR